MLKTQSYQPIQSFIILKNLLTASKDSTHSVEGFYSQRRRILLTASKIIDFNLPTASKDSTHSVENY